MRIVLLLASLLGASFISSCSFSPSPQIKRELAADHAQSPLTANQLFTFERTGFTDKIPKAESMIKDTLSNYITAIKFVEDKTLPPNEAFRFIPSVEQNQFIIKIIHSTEALSDSGASLELVNFAKAISWYLRNPINIYEVFFNAQANDFTSLHVLAKLRKEASVLALKVPRMNGKLLSSNDYFLEQEKHWDSILAIYQKESRIHNKKVKEHEEKRKVRMNALDKASDDKQFKNLVAKNDRKGTAELIRSYLPWEQMPPVEKRYWEIQLEIMANPLPIEERVIVYRGVDDDQLQAGYSATKVKRTVSEAIKDQDIFLMSTLLTKNQGTWNRRLRSLTAMYDKFIGITDETMSSEYTRAARINHMFQRHSVEPKGSPFLSYTSSFQTSKDFGSQRNTAFFADPRALYFNHTSIFSEFEYLAPLVSFPEDLAAVYDREIHSDVKNVHQFFNETSLEKLQKLYGSNEGIKIYEKIKSNTQAMFQPLDKIIATNSTVVPNGKIINLFKEIGNFPDKSTEILPPNQLSCNDIIKQFWK